MIKLNDNGYITLIKDENYTTAELKRLIKRLEKEYGDKKNLEEVKKEIGNSRKGWRVDYYLYNGIWEDCWKQCGRLQITEYRM